MWALLSCNTRAQSGTVVLDLYDTSGGVDWTDTIASAPDSCKTGGYWRKTYTNASVAFGQFALTHTGGVYPGTTYNYWSGFTTGANGDTYCYSDSTHCTCCRTPIWCDSLGSGGWINNQWGVMAGGGIDAIVDDSAVVKKGDPYLIAFWDYYTEESGTHVLEVNLADNSFFKPQEVYICNHPWPYYGNLYGDGFAHPLDSIGDHFDLWIHAVKANGGEDSIRYFLARFDSVQQKLVQSPNWVSVDLTDFFGGEDNDSIQSLYFTMYSTDSDPMYGPNTAVYFNMDKLKVLKQDGTVAPAATLRAKTTKATAKPAVKVKDYFPLTSYTGGDVTVHDAKGKVVLKTTVKAGEKPNLSKLPAGEYRLRHGHRTIPVKKVK